MSSTAMPPDLTEHAVAEFSQLSPKDRIAAVAEALEHNGIRAFMVESGDEARKTVATLIPPGAEVFNNTSRTLESIGVADDIERSGRYEPLRLRLFQMDREMQGREMRTLAASPDYVVGSVHAVTEGGSLLIASASGSQLGPIVSGAATRHLCDRGSEDRPRPRNRDPANLSNTRFRSRTSGHERRMAFPAG